MTRDQPTTCCYCGDVILPSDVAVYRLNGAWECTGCNGPEYNSCADEDNDEDNDEVTP